MTEKPPKIPLALSEQNVSRHHRRVPGTGEIIPDSTIRLAEQAMREGRVLAEQAAASFATITADPSLTQAARLARAEKVVGQLAETIAKKLDKALAGVDESIRTIRRDNGGPPTPATPMQIQIEAEVRSRIAAMSNADRIAAVQRAIVEDDATVISAVLSAPGMLTGTTAEAQSGWLAAYRQRKHPEAFDREQRLAKVRADLTRAGHALVGWRDNLFNHSEAQRLMSAAREANDAAVAAAKAAAAEENV
jgi:hypothetical protein